MRIQAPLPRRTVFLTSRYEISDKYPGGMAAGDTAMSALRTAELSRADGYRGTTGPAQAAPRSATLSQIEKAVGSDKTTTGGLCAPNDLLKSLFGMLELAC
jgi:hypothetical protein